MKRGAVKDCKGEVKCLGLNESRRNSIGEGEQKR